MIEDEERREERRGEKGRGEERRGEERRDMTDERRGKRYLRKCPMSGMKVSIRTPIRCAISFKKLLHYTKIRAGSEMCALSSPLRARKTSSGVHIRRD